MTQRCIASSISNCRSSLVSFVNLEHGSSVFMCAKKEGLALLSCCHKIVGIEKYVIHIPTPSQDVQTRRIPDIKNLGKSKIMRK
jgi:hypothetical protein